MQGFRRWLSTQLPVGAPDLEVARSRLRIISMQSAPARPGLNWVRDIKVEGLAKSVLVGQDGILRRRGKPAPNLSGELPQSCRTPATTSMVPGILNRQDKKP